MMPLETDSYQRRDSSFSSDNPMRLQPDSSASAESGDWYSDLLSAIGWQESETSPGLPPTRERDHHHHHHKKKKKKRKKKASPSPSDPAGDQLDDAERGGWLAMENLTSLHINDARRPRVDPCGLPADPVDRPRDPCAVARLPSGGVGTAPARP